MKDSVRVHSGPRWLDKRVMEDTISLNQRARFAVGFVERWGAISTVPDGEDIAGRQAFRMMSPIELVTRANETAELLFAVLIANGWAVEVPEYEAVETEDAKL